MGEANISWITNQVATGGDFSFDPEKARRQMEELLNMDIDLVIDCRVEANDEALWDLVGMDYVHLPTDDEEGHTIPDQHFDAAYRASQPVLAQGGRVFVHCHMGVNRGPSTAYAILLAEGTGSLEAFDMIRRARPQAAIYYASDALKWHLNTTGWSEKGIKAQMDAFEAHHAKVFTKEDRKKIAHVIRTSHETDAVEMARYGGLDA